MTQFHQNNMNTELSQCLV